MIFITNISFIVTFRCNCYCKHCSVNASPHRNEIISIKTIDKVISSAYDIPEIKVIIFTGG